MKRFFVTVLRRLVLALKILSRIALFVLPIPLLMVYVNYTVDCSGLFQGDILPRQVALDLIDGKNLANFSQMDERQVISLYAQNLPEEQTPDVLAIGSSRVLSLTYEQAGARSFFNAGMTGADARDVMSSYYLFARAGRAPKTVIFCVDPWLLYAGENAYDYRSDPELYAEFLQQALGIDTGYEEPDKVKLWKALIDPAYFQGNIQYYLKNRDSSVVHTEDGQATPFIQVSDNELYSQATNVKRWDGSVLYDEGFRSLSAEETEVLALTQAGTFDTVNMEGFDALDEGACRRFEQFISYMQSQGSQVILLLSPYHPLVEYILDTEISQGKHQGFAQVEPWLRQFAQEHQISLYGSYRPEVAGVEGADFYDGLHIRTEAIQKYFPGVSAALDEGYYLQPWPQN